MNSLIESKGRMAPAAATAAVVLAAVLLRVAVSGFPLWYDEWASVYFATLPQAKLWSAWMVRETNPALFYSLLKLWRGALGDSLAALRALPITGGALLVPAIMACAHAASGRRGALIAGLLAALAAQEVYYSVSLRAYVFLALALTLSLLGLLLTVADGGRSGGRPRTGLLLYAAAATVAIYLHSTAILWPPAATAAAALLAWRDGAPAEGMGVAIRRALGRIWPLLVADGAIVLGAGWALWIVAHQLTQGGTPSLNWIPHLSPVAFLDLAWSSICLVRIDGVVSRVIGAAVLALVAWGAVRHRTARIELVALALAFLLAGFFLVSVRKPIALERTLFWLNSLTIMLLAHALANLARATLRTLAVATLAAALALNTWHVRATFMQDDWAGFIRAQQPAAAVPIVVVGHSSAIVGATACALELQTRCPLTFIAFHNTYKSPPVWDDDYRGPQAAIVPGAATGLRGPVYLLGDTDPFIAITQGRYPPRFFGSLRRVGPVPGEALRFR